MFNCLNRVCVYESGTGMRNAVRDECVVGEEVCKPRFRMPYWRFNVKYRLSSEVMSH